ncbi:MAG: transposase [Patescibacteria group bacterium]|nr:transposase [Patescibacteria group bacterium]
MPYRRIFFEKNQPFHVLSRAVEGIKILKEESDCYRAIYQFHCANLGTRGFNLETRDIIKAAQSLLNGEEIPPKFIIKQHPPLVYLLDFAFVIDHYHLYLLPNIENGVPFLIKKLNGGFAKFFNLKHKRRDALFGSRYKAIAVKTQFQSDAVSRYVSIINPLDVFQPGWRKEGLRDWKEAFDFLENYQFSSFPDRIGKRNAKILAPKEILWRYSLGGDKKDYLKFVEAFLKQKLANFQPFFLE